MSYGLAEHQDLLLTEGLSLLATSWLILSPRRLFACHPYRFVFESDSHLSLFIFSSFTGSPFAEEVFRFWHVLMAWIIEMRVELHQLHSQPRFEIVFPMAGIDELLHWMLSLHLFPLSLLTSLQSVPLPQCNAITPSSTCVCVGSWTALN